jgi:hypothetical protein
MEQRNLYHYSKHTKTRDIRFQNFVFNFAAHSRGRLPLMKCVCVCVCVCVCACGRVYVSRKVPTGTGTLLPLPNLAYNLVAQIQGWLSFTKIYKYINREMPTNNRNLITNHVLLRDRSSFPLYSTVLGTAATFIPNSVVISVLRRWNEMSKLSFSKKWLHFQNKYLITAKSTIDHCESRCKGCKCPPLIYNNN